MEKLQKQHLAIFNPPFLDLILEGRKTIEGRFSKVRCAPFGVIEEGDVVLMKESGGLVRGSFVVAKVESFDNLSQKMLKDLEIRYSVPLCADADPQYWEKRRVCRYATMLHIAQPCRFEQPFPFPKKDRRGWVVLKGGESDQLSLFSDKREVGVNEARERMGEYNSSQSRCEEGLHTFFHTTLFNQIGYPRCRWCGADCVDWHLLHRKDSTALTRTITELRKEYWRNSWFGRSIDERARNHALRKGKKLLREHATSRIRNSIGSAQPYRDGFQTPYTGNVVFYAQHAVAACCRNCVEVWHGIPKGKQLTDREVAYFADLVMKYVDVVMPELKEEGVHIPPIKKPKYRKE